MNLWIVTTGSSDVQLIDNEDLDWYGWRHNIEKFIYRLPFELKRSIDEDGEPYRLHARVLSIAYNHSPDQVKPYLTFPLLKNFSDKLKEKKINIDQIIVLVSDQTDIFPEDVRETVRCPYWQDTCELYPIVEGYLKEHFPAAVIQPFTLRPEPFQKGLDDWDSVLDLVGKAFKDLTFDAEPETIFVSHQAGTPAISSAVQFCSLAKFYDRVKFLVSNEYNQEITDIIPSSNYLIALKKQKAEKLLDHYDYSAVKETFSKYLSDENNLLLDAAIQWNFAKFKEFAQELEKHQDFQEIVQARTKEENWWWTAYEAAYLAFVRLAQVNGVEAFFHSFRAVEGLISVWAEVHFSEHIDPNNDSPKLKASILEVPNLNYFGKSKYAEHKAKLEQDGVVILSGFPLYALLRSAKPSWKKDCKEITDFIEKIAPTRNKVFHRLRGLEIDDVFEAWLIDGTKAIEEKKLILEEKISKYLNFVSDQNFKSLKEASLMVKVHQELEKAIANL